MMFSQQFFIKFICMFPKYIPSNQLLPYNQYMIKHLLIVAACILFAFATCPINNHILDIQVGSTTFDIQSSDIASSNNRYNHVFKQPFSNSPRIALALSSFSLRASNFTYWSIIPGQVSPSAMELIFAQQPQYWISTKVIFIASARPDITVGQYQASFPPIKENMVTVNFNLNTQVANVDGAVTRVYITGYRRLSGNSMDIRLMSRELTVTSLTTYIQTGQDLEIDSAVLNYIIFNPNQAGFASYRGGISRKNFAGNFVNNIQKEIHSSQNAFYGLVSLKFTAQGSLNIDASIVQPFYATFSVPRTVDEFSYYFIVLGVSPSSLCSQCQQKYAYKEECVNSCPSDSILVNYQDGAQNCRICPNSLNMVVQNGICECAPGFKLEDGLCISTSGVFSASVTNNNQIASTQTIIKNIQDLNPPKNPQPNPEPERTKSRRTQSYIPNIVNNAPNPQGSHSFVPPSQPQKVEEKSADCTKMPNSYSIGSRCVCKVGYSFENGICVKKSLISDPNIFKPAQFLYKISHIYTNQKPVGCSKPNQYFDGEKCICTEGFRMNANGDCILKNIPDLTCPPNSKPEYGACICFQGYIKKGSQCIRENKCPPYSYHNGIQCVCETGYYMKSGICIKGSPCPAYSERIHGKCKCLAGYRLVNDKCARCPEGEVYIPSENKCIVTCGVNQIVHPQTRKCECKPGFGKYEGICNICPHNFFIHNGFCATCPAGSEFSQAQGKCICGPGLILHSSGYCQEICTRSYQFYHGPSKSCRCQDGLARINQNCQICSGVINPITQECQHSCGLNSVNIGGKCVCNSGFGYNNQNKCIDCSTIVGGFVIDGYCATCPSGQILIGYQCKCPAGQTFKHNKCVDDCKPGQLVDHQGYCYDCPLAKKPVNGRCQCRDGFVSSGNNCIQKCKLNEYLINGRCAVCALNTIYDSKLKACVCPPGFYMTTNGICEQSVLPPIDCPAGKYFKPNTGCVDCSFGCSQCKNANICIKCNNPDLIPQGNKCVARCGDSKIASTEQCDDGNIKNGDGCSNKCKIEPNYSCSGTPSFCVYSGCGDGKIQAGQQCDDYNKKNGDGCDRFCKIEPSYTCEGEPSECQKKQKENHGMKLANKVMINYSNVFLMLRTDHQFFFNNQSEKRNFMQYKFPDDTTYPNSVYCLQQSNDPSLFRCMMMYSSGVPNKKFKVNFFFDYKGDQGSVIVEIDPSKSAFQTRSLA